MLAPDGLFAAWCYGDPRLEDQKIHQIIHGYNRGTVEEYWPPERNLVLTGYRTIEFPFREISTPTLILEAAWTLPQLAGYLRSWSATTRYAKVLGRDPVVSVEEELRSVWGAPETAHTIRWPLTIRAGRP